MIGQMFNLTAHTTAHISIDCIKTCPYKENLFALAYYQTNPDTQGAIAVAQLNGPQDIHKIVPIETPPLLHMVWAKLIGEDKRFILAAATRQDDIFIYTYDTTNNSLIHAKTLKIGEQVFCLYLDMLTYEDHYKLIVSSNESTVTDLILDTNFQIQDKKIYSKHEYAVWTCRINPFQKDSFVCGDEVNSIYLYAQGQLVARNKKAHQQGICDLTFGQDNLLHSGGFDGIVCTFDLRKFNECLYTSNWGGTIWRVLPDANNNNILLCNSSQKKFQIVDPTLSKQLWNSGPSHESLAYAADWGKNSLVTASFYDKKLCYWNSQHPQTQ